MQSLSKNVNRCGSYVPLGSLHHAKDVYDSSQVCSRPLQTVLSCPLSPSSSSSLLVPPLSPLSLLSLVQASLFQLETNNVIHGRAGHCAKPPPTSYHIYNASTQIPSNESAGRGYFIAETFRALVVASSSIESNRGSIELTSF
jgi:hypothetical protein